MKGLGIPRKDFNAILNDDAWAPLLVHDKDGHVFVDLKKYSDRKAYLPVKSEFQSHIVGFLLVKKLWACPYRTQDDLVYIFPETSTE